MHTLATSGEAGILKRVIQPETADLAPEVARALLKFKFPEADHSRMAELSAKAGEGTRTLAEQQDLDSYITVSHFIAFVQSKARMSLKNSPVPGAA